MPTPDEAVADFKAAVSACSPEVITAFKKLVIVLRLQTNNEVFDPMSVEIADIP